MNIWRLKEREGETEKRGGAAERKVSGKREAEGGTE